MVLWDVAGRERLTEEPLPVQEGSVLSIALQSRRQNTRGGVRGRRRRRGWC